MAFGVRIGVRPIEHPNLKLNIQREFNDVISPFMRYYLTTDKNYIKLQFMGVPTLSPRWKTTPAVSISRDAVGSCVVRDLEHVHKLHAREPGGPTFGLLVRSAL
jgi:hypothetical protein